MQHELQTLVKGIAPWLQCVGTHGVRDDEVAKALDVFDMDDQKRRDAHRDTGRPTGWDRRPPLRTPLARRLCASRPSRGCQGSELDSEVDPVQVIEAEERIVPRRPRPPSAQSSAAPVAGPRVARNTHSRLRMHGFRP